LTNDFLAKAYNRQRYERAKEWLESGKPDYERFSFLAKK